MCDEARVDGQWCSTQGELRRALGLTREQLPMAKCYQQPGRDPDCLCGVDIKLAARRAKMEARRTDDLLSWIIERTKDTPDAD